MSDIMREHARLIALRFLSEEPSGRANSATIQDEMAERWGITRSRDWVHAELRWLADVGAITVTEAGSVLVVALTARGIDHVERRIVIDGVKRPSLRS